MADIIRPISFSHVVYRTWRFDTMLKWYLAVFGARIQYHNDRLAFLAYDDEHHRVVIASLGAAQPADEPPRRRQGVDHVAYGFAGLHTLLDKYIELKAQGILPYWCIHHGITVSMYYADPDGNQMEFQTDCYPSAEQANTFMHGPGFAINPIGVEFDPEALIARLHAGEPESALLPRTEHLPVSEIPQPQPERTG